MLDHQITGVHYACSASDLLDGNCQQRITKSGATVRVCSCSNADFCNQDQWSTVKDKSAIETDSKGTQLPDDTPASKQQSLPLTTSLYLIAVASLVILFV
ncbi:unnamed protein product [Enterobius vermicularis]|uniref:Activin_recp domain-containing protein n=1 Tax=Enterobius vermicularis TaxID=51028 RepID=A0A0N4VPU0_ENTVE|nr:unnamed protein product [Enterobius vermicularis]